MPPTLCHVQVRGHALCLSLDCFVMSCPGRRPRGAVLCTILYYVQVRGHMEVRLLLLPAGRGEGVLQLHGHGARLSGHPSQAGQYFGVTVIIGIQFDNCQEDTVECSVRDQY